MHTLGRRIWVAGHRGMVGSAIVRRLATEDCEILSVGREQLDLRRQREVEGFIAGARPDIIVVAAGTVGGIAANASRPADFINDNLLIATNIITAAHAAAVPRLLYLSSSCGYPKFAEQPIREEALLSGLLEPTNEAYAIAKIAGVQLAQAYRHQHGRDYFAATPTNLYGPGDCFHPERSHVLGALIAKAHEARISGAPELVLWGSGTPLREFMYVDDCADALVHLLKHNREHAVVNVGTGEEVSILELARMVCDIVGYCGRITNDLARPDGTPRKLLDCSRLRGMGWKPRIGLRDGIAATYRWYLQHHAGEEAA